MTGWGQHGPYSQAAGHDLNYIALAGALHPMGEPGAPPPVPLNLVGDFGGGGLLLAFGVVAALYERERSGLGQVLDVAMIDGVASLLTSVCMLDAMGLWSRERGGNWLDGSAPWYRPYRTADGRYVTVGSLEPQFYALLLERLGLDAGEWPEWDTARWPAMVKRLEAVFATRTLAEWSELLDGTDVCFAPVLRIDEAAAHPHLAARGTYVEQDGRLQPAPAPRFSAHAGGDPPPAAVARTAHRRRAGRGRRARPLTQRRRPLAPASAHERERPRLDRVGARPVGGGEVHPHLHPALTREPAPSAGGEPDALSGRRTGCHGEAAGAHPPAAREAQPPGERRCDPQLDTHPARLGTADGGLEAGPQRRAQLLGEAEARGQRRARGARDDLGRHG